jgi:hypothetical protein
VSAVGVIPHVGDRDPRHARVTAVTIPLARASRGSDYPTRGGSPLHAPLPVGEGRERERDVLGEGVES